MTALELIADLQKLCEDSKNYQFPLRILDEIKLRIAEWEAQQKAS